MAPSASQADRTYAVTWRGADGVETTCTHLSPRIAFARLWAAWKASGEIVVTDIQPEWLESQPKPTKDWPYPVSPPDCDEAKITPLTMEGWICVTHDATGFMCPACTLWSEENAAIL